MKLLLTVREAAEALSLSQNGIYNLINGGQLRSVKIGRSRRISSDALAEFIQTLAENSDVALRETEERAVR